MNPLHAVLMAALEFVSLSMLGWLAAASLPWLIHRWWRRQPRQTTWAAVDLLLAAMQQRARRVQMQQWLLLAVRTLILASVAVAAAEPIWREWSPTFGSRALVHRVIVIDQSCSMRCQQADSSRWTRAKEAAKQWIERSTDDPVTLIAWGEQAENLLGRPTLDGSLATAALDQMSPSHSSVELSTVVGSIRNAIDRAQQEFPQLAGHEIIVCTDLCPPTWQIGEAKLEALDEIAQQANITFINVAEASRDNIAVTDIQIAPELVLRQREASIVANVTNFGTVDSTECRVELQVDGRIVDSQQVQIGDEDQSTVRFRHRFVDEGSSSVAVKLVNHQDSLAIDDRREVVVDVRRQLRVACFTGAAGAADDLARALSPGNGTDADVGGDIRADVFSLARFPELNLNNYNALVLADATDLAPREITILQDYVRQGGGLTVFLGPQTDAKQVSALDELLPVRSTGEKPTGDFRFDPLEYRHPIVAPFRGQTQAGLLRVATTQYRQLQLAEEHRQAEVVLQFDSNDPALVVDQYGLGRVAVSALPGSLAARTEQATPWSSFAVSPSFLPVMRELVAYLVADNWQQQRNVLVGETIVVPWTQVAQAVRVRLPNGTERELPRPTPDELQQLVFCETGQAGIYTFFAEGEEIARYAVNLNPHESNLTPIDSTKLPATLTEQRIDTRQAYASFGGGISLGRPLLAMVAVLLLIEIALAWSLAKGWA